MTKTTDGTMYIQKLTTTKRFPAFSLKKDASNTFATFSADASRVVIAGLKMKI